MGDDLKEIKDSVEKHFGKGSLILMGDEEQTPAEVIPTGIFSMDKALKIQGFPRGRMVEIFGPESTGKTTLALYVAAEAQKKGLPVAFIDAEHSLDLKMAKQLGVDIDNLLVAQPDYGEQALEMVEHLVRTGKVGVIIVDSVAALTPKAEIDGEMGDSHMGLQARLMSQSCRKLTGIISKSNTLVIWINQVRMKIGVFFGNPETTTGGIALKFYSSLRLEVRSGSKILDNDHVIGHQMKVKVVKNKLAAPFATAEFPLIYGQGVDIAGDVFDLAVQAKLVEQKGSWFSYGTTKLGQGRDSAIEKVAEAGIFNEIKEKLNAESMLKVSQE